MPAPPSIKEAFLRPGTVLSDRFEIRSLAGTGGFASVYRALDRTEGGLAAVKVLHPRSEHIERFGREAQILMTLRHPGIVRYLAHGVTSTGCHYLAMEWLDGETLDARLGGAGLSVAETITVGALVARALEVAHDAGVVHRDVKPSNLFLVGGAANHVKLLDFGIARPRQSVTLTGVGLMMGTPGYIAPEQARGERDVDGRADIFALGCVLFRCLTGRGPFLGEDALAILLQVVLEDAPYPSDFKIGVPDALDDLVARMMARLPDDRPRGVAEVAAELDRIAVEQGKDSPPVSLGRASPRSLPDRALTASEQRVACFVVARPSPADESVHGSADPAELLRAAVARHGGKLDLLADGSLLVTLQGGEVATDRAARAARCGLAMRALLGEIPIALVAGREAAAAPIGQVAERGIRLLNAGSSAGVRLDEVAAALLDARFELARDASGLYLLGARREGADTARALLGKSTPCVGRDRELATLEAMFDDCVADSASRAVLVTGAAGIGKSRVRHELLRALRARGEPLEIWMSRGDPMSAGSPFAMIAPAIRRAAGMLDGEPAAVRREKLAARVERHVAPADQRRVTHFLGELVGAPFSDDTDVQLRAARRDAMLMGDQMCAAWEALVAAECGAHPLVLVLEDLQWGDVPSVRFIDAALRALHDRPLLVLAFGRPEMHDAFPKIWRDRRVQEVRLGELTRKGGEKLVRAVLGDAVSARTVAALVERSAGNAFYLEELIRAAAEGKEDDLPDTVLAMVEARLAVLEPEARRVLRAAALYGRAFWRGGIAALLGDGGMMLDEWLGVLVDREIIDARRQGRFPGEIEYVFRSALVREAAYAMLTEADRALGHVLAGQWLEAAGETDAMVLAEHFERAGQPARAIASYQRAAEQALGGNDLAAAIERAGKAIGCGAAGETLGALLAILGEAYSWRGELRAAVDSSLDAMEQLARGSARWHAAAGFAARASSKLGDRRNLVAIGEELAALPVEAIDGAYVATVARVTVQLYIAGRADLARTLLARPREAGVIDSTLDPIALGWVCTATATGAKIAGDLSEFVARTEQAAQSFERAGDRRSACGQQATLGYAYLELGAYEQAERMLHEALVNAESMDLSVVRGSAAQNLGIVLVRRGAHAEALKIETQAVESFRAQGDVRMEAASRAYLAEILAVVSGLPAAVDEARRALDVASDVPLMKATILGVLADLLVQQGHPEEALHHAEEGMALLASAGGLDEGDARLRLAHARALRSLGRNEEAAGAIARAREQLLAMAARLEGTEWQKSFLERVPENAATLDLARAWCDGGAGA